MTETIVDEIRERARERPDQPAWVAAGPPRTQVSYGELARRIAAQADALHAAGVTAGERCGLMAEQGPDFVEAALAILAAGGCLVPVAEEHRDAGLRAFAAAAHLQRVVTVRDGGLEVAARDEPGIAAEAEFRALRPAYLRFTSGTTNRRKGVILGHASVRARVAAANRALAVGPEDRVLWLLPMAHHFVVSILLYLSRGATLLLPAGSLARPALELAAAEGATLIYASPHHHRLLAKDASDLSLPRLRLAVSTAEGLRAEVAERFQERFGLPLTQALGIIEVGLPVANRVSAASKPEALGRPLPDFEVWLRGEDGRALAGPGSAERTGEICIRGPGLFDAYLEPWLPAARVLEPDGFRTGDQGWFDADGDLHLAGRRANRISMAGMKFFGEEVEAVLDRHPAVSASRVFGREHPHLGEIPVAELVPVDPAAPPDRAALAAFCREALPAYKIPREFRVVKALARTVTGKIARGDAAPDSAAPSR